MLYRHMAQWDIAAWLAVLLVHLISLFAVACNMGQNWPLEAAKG